MDNEAQDSRATPITVDEATRRWLLSAPHRHVQLSLAKAVAALAGCVSFFFWSWGVFGSPLAGAVSATILGIVLVVVAWKYTKYVHGLPSRLLAEAAVPKPWTPVTARIGMLQNDPEHYWVVIEPDRPRHRRLAVLLFAEQLPDFGPPVEVHGVPRRHALLILRTGDRVLWPQSRAYGGWYARLVAGQLREGLGRPPFLR